MDILKSNKEEDIHEFSFLNLCCVFTFKNIVMISADIRHFFFFNQFISK